MGPAVLIEEGSGSSGRVRWPGRVAASLLHAAGLPELVTETLADYEKLAVTLAVERSLRDSTRQKLARSRLDCALFDTVRFTRHLEVAYATMVQILRNGEEPRSFAVKSIGGLRDQSAASR
jgi:protein O-GlcNAc transferase